MTFKGFISELKPYFSTQLQNSYEEHPDEFILDDIKINRMNKEYLSVTPNEFKLEKSADGLVVLYRNEKFQAVSAIADIFTQSAVFLYLPI